MAEAAGDPGTKTDALRAAFLERGVMIEAADDLGGALGTSTAERIQILNGLSPAETFVVLAHEYAHCLLHRADDGRLHVTLANSKRKPSPLSSAKPSGSKSLMRLATTFICIGAIATLWPRRSTEFSTQRPSF